MGGGDSRLAFAGRPPTVILLVGLQGSGKTTAAGEARAACCARRAARRCSSPPTSSARRRSTQLEQLGRQIQIPVYSDERADPVAGRRAGHRAGARRGPRRRHPRHRRPPARRRGADGRARTRAATRRSRTNVLLVLDAMTGQEAVNVAHGVPGAGRVRRRRPDEARRRRARRRGALRPAVTGKPIKLVSVGEKLDQLEVFHPDRMASRILGMGDVLTLIERAEEAVERGRAEGDGEADARRRVHVRRLPPSSRMMRKMGPLQGVLKMIPGLGKQLEGRRRRRGASSTRRGDHPLDDAARAAPAAPDRRLAPAADRARAAARRSSR